MYKTHPGIVPAPNSRSIELLEQLRQEFENQFRNTGELERQLTSQLQEMELIRQKVYELEQAQIKMKESHKAEIQVLQHKLQSRGMQPMSPYITNPQQPSPSLMPPPTFGHAPSNPFDGVMSNQGGNGPNPGQQPRLPPGPVTPQPAHPTPASQSITGDRAGNMLGDWNLNDLPTSQKKEGTDWHAIFNPDVKRVLDVELIHDLVHESVACCVCFTRDGKYLATGCNWSAQIFDVTTGQKVVTLHHPKSGNGDDVFIRSVCFGPDGKYLATGAEDKQIRVWDIKTCTIKYTFAGHEQEIYSLDFAGNGQYIASGSGDKTVRLWDICNGKLIYSFNIEDGVTAVAMSPDGRYVAAGSLDMSVHIWDTTTGYWTQRLGGPDGHTDSVYSITFAPNGKDLISGSLDKSVKTWELNGPYPGTAVNAGKCVRTFKGHKDFVLTVCLTPDSRWIISGSKDRRVQLWDPSTGNAHMMLQGHTNSVLSVAASPTNNLFATGGGDKRARIWRYTEYNGR